MCRVIDDAVKAGKENFGFLGICAVFPEFKDATEAGNRVDLRSESGGHVEQEAVLFSHFFKALKFTAQLVAFQNAAGLAGRQFFEDKVVELVD